MRKDIMISGICALSLIMLTQNAYAQTYEKESESGKVRFQCELEVPENWNGKEIPKFILESVHFVDSEKTYANFVEGKEILEHYNTPASDLYPEENYYVLADGTNVGIGMEFGVSTEKSAYYAQIGVTNTENMEKFTSATESIVNDQDAVQKVKETLENAGYAVENLVFQTSSLSADILREIENQYVAEGLLEESKRKPEWTNEDDVCIVYARQTVSGIPVYPELSFIQALAMSVGFGRKGMLTHFTWYWVLIITLIWTASAGALAFVGNYMTEKKLCNGVSLILACNILSGVLDDLFSLWETAFTGHKTAQGILYISLLVVFIFLMTFFVVYLQTGKREIPVTNARKFNGRVNPAAMKSTLPIPVNPSNVIPVIFASCIFSIPSMIAMVVTPKSGSVWAHIVNLTNTSDWFRPSEFYYTAGWIVYVALILFFEVFYNNIIFNVLEISDNMKKAGSQIPGIRPGADTAEYLRKKVKHTTLLGGIGISIVATVPMVLSGVFHISNISLMGTSLVIIVGVIIENARQIDADTSAYKFEGIIR